jgi:hypothetical protein
MKRPMCIAAFCIAFMISHEALAQPKYPLLCRGPLSYAVGTGQGTTVVFFERNASKSGSQGGSLQPGTCAWTDRPVAASEPSKIYVKPETSNKVRAAFIAFAACARESNCVVEFLAYNAFTPSDPHFRVEDGYIRVYFPNF